MNRKNYIRHNFGFLLVWLCSGITFYAYQIENKWMGLFFTFLSALYFPLVKDKDE